MQRHSPSPFVDHLLALAIAVTLPLLSLIWLLQPVSPLPLPASSMDARDLILVQRIPVTRKPAAPAIPPRAIELFEEEMPDLPPPSEATAASSTPPPGITTGAVSEATVGLPVESGGSVYDPSVAQAHAIAASDRLRSVGLRSDDSPARVDPLSLAEHAPLPPSTLGSADRSGAKVEVVIDPSGIAIEINVVEGSGDAALDAAILDAAKTWSYEPARAEGEAVTSQLRLDVTLEREVDSDSSATFD